MLQLKFSSARIFAIAALAAFPARGADSKPGGDILYTAPDNFEGKYPISYKTPTAEEITALMLRVADHAQHYGAPQVVDSTTNAEITDFSIPNPHASTNPGSYSIGVLHAGMILAGEVTGDRRFTDYTASRLQFIADRLPYFKAFADKFGYDANPYRNFLNPTSLDACGAWGAALVKARLAGVGPDLKPVIDRWADYVSHRQFRLSDGTVARSDPRPDTIWADDMYMSVPFLAQLGRLTGDTRYYDDAARQVLQISARLFIWNKGLFAHGWSAGNADYNPEFHWGRANGWALMAMCELLDVLPESHPARGQILKIFRTHIQSLAPLQSDHGLWHQLLDKNDSYLETSCSAMFTYAIAHAVNRGWVSAASFGPVAQAGWNGVASRIGTDGSVDGVCVGTSLASDALYYYYRPERDDEHGYGAVLLAGSEMIRVLRNPHLSIHELWGGAAVYDVK
jgi:rhamnogalacturonyl hydrolase YesR